jgi:DNA-binding transcriptional MerR regulator
MPSRPPQLLTIGQFAALTDISRPSLRRYDEAGLLRPALIDDATGYRYYTVAQLDVAETIRLLRDLQVPLADIQALLVADDGEGLKRLLAVHRRRVAEQLERDARVLARVDQVLSQDLPLIPQSHEVSVIELPETTVISCRGESPPSLKALIAARAACAARLKDRVAKERLTPAGPVLYLYELDLFAPWYSPARFQACQPLAAGSPLPPDSWTLPACTAAATVHTGPLDGLRASWAALAAWVGRSDYDAGPSIRVTYTARPDDPSDPTGFVTHYALPIRPA